MKLGNTFGLILEEWNLEGLQLMKDSLYAK